MKNEEFFDEQILDMLNQSEQMSTGLGQSSDKKNDNKETEERSIYTGIRINGKWIHFERQLFAGDTISMMIPDTFAPMEKEAIKIKYPSEHRPETILTDETGTVNLMFQYMEGDVDSSTIETFRNQVFGLMKYANPGIKEREVGEIDNEGNRIAYVEFTNNALGGKLYNLMFYISVNGRPLMGSFNCITKDMKYWQPVAVEMMQSIQIVE
ncbi:MAG: hypothetical protein IJC02_08870 [Lachnospiraceae bacterium]|nr:hypothetical protein [Lachnospiraceae bacterium]